jgi:predicted RecA/RadA family phage recombinase
MAKNFVQPGDTVTVIAPRNVNPGDGVLVGALFGIALSAALAGANVEIKTKGVWDQTKAVGAVTQGQKLYWDNAAFNVTTTAGGNTVIGVSTQAAASADATARVKLNEAVPA